MIQSKQCCINTYSINPLGEWTSLNTPVGGKKSDTIHHSRSQREENDRDERGVNRFRVKIFSLGANHGGSFHKRRDTATVSAPLRLGDHRPYSAVIHCAHVTAHESLFLWSGGCPVACLRLVPAYRAVELACGARVNSPEQTVWGGGDWGICSSQDAFKSITGVRVSGGGLSWVKHGRGNTVYGYYSLNSRPGARWPNTTITVRVNVLDCCGALGRANWVKSVVACLRTETKCSSRY